MTEQPVTSLPHQILIHQHAKYPHVVLFDCQHDRRHVEKADISMFAHVKPSHHSSSRCTAETVWCSLSHNLVYVDNQLRGIKIKLFSNAYNTANDTNDTTNITNNTTTSVILDEIHCMMQIMNSFEENVFDCQQTWSYVSLQYRQLKNLIICPSDVSSFQAHFHHHHHIRIMLVFGKNQGNEPVFVGRLWNTLFSNKHSILSQLNDTLLSNQVFDTMIIVKHPENNTILESIPATKFILAGKSPVFYEMLTSDQVEGADSVVVIHEHDVQSVHNMIDYFYTEVFIGEAWKKCVSLLKMAFKYRIVGLQKACEYHLVANVYSMNIVELWTMAKDYELEELQYSILQEANHNFLSSGRKNGYHTNCESARKLLELFGVDFVLFNSNIHPLQQKRRKDNLERHNNVHLGHGDKEEEESVEECENGEEYQSSDSDQESDSNFEDQESLDPSIDRMN